MRYERTELEQALQGLVDSEKPTYGLLGAIIGLVPATLFLVLMSKYFFLNLIVASCVFPAISGLFARYVGSLYSTASRIPVMLTVGCSYILLGLLFEAKVIWFLATPIPFGVALLVSKKKLSRLEEFAVMEHASKPFSIKEKPVSRKIAQPLAIVFALPVCASVYLLLPDNLCREAIEDNQYSQLGEKCRSSAADTFKALLAGDAPVLDHKFGTYYSPSEEAKLIRSKAQAGDEQSIFMWWSILNGVYPAGPFASRFVGTETFNNEVKLWRRKAAMLGYQPAVQEELYTYVELAKKQRPLKVKQQAQQFANQLVSANVDGAEALLETANQIVTKEDVVGFYQKQLENLEVLSFDELDNLLFATEEGEFHYYLSDFIESLPKQGYYTDSIVVDKDDKMTLEILKFLSAKHDNADASYRLFRTFRTSEKYTAFTYLELAASQGHLTAIEQLGIHLFCQKRRMEGLIWIKKAAEMGSSKAQKRRTEIAKTNQLEECR